MLLMENSELKSIPASEAIDLSSHAADVHYMDEQPDEIKYGWHVARALQPVEIYKKLQSYRILCNTISIQLN